MSDLAETRPKFEKIRILSHISTYYGLTGELSPLPSERDQNFLLTTSKGEKFVCKIANYLEDVDHLTLQNKIIEHIHSTNPTFVSKIHPNQDGDIIGWIKDNESNEYMFRLVDYLEGSILAEYIPHNTALMNSVGEFIAKLSQSLENSGLQLTKREFIWDIEFGLDTINSNMKHIHNQKKLKLIEFYIKQFDKRYLSNLAQLKRGIIHGDANDYNLIVQNTSLSKFGFDIGIIDFGDIVYSIKIAELAIAIAYAILDKPNPLSTMLDIIKGYSSIRTLNDEEIEILFKLVLMRLCLSVSISAYQQKQEPQNNYLSISERSAWETLFKLKSVSPRFVYYAIKYVTESLINQNSRNIVDWMKLHKFQPLFKSTSKYTIIDLSFGSLEIEGYHNADDLAYYKRTISKKLENYDFIVGRYGESRLMYIHNQFRKDENYYSSWRSVHLGIDLFNQPGSDICAPMAGIVHMIADNNDYLDYGPTVILEHKIRRGLSFFTLYGHLSRESIERIHIGQNIGEGKVFAQVGNEKENGSWPPHLHFQIIVDLLDFDSTFPGVCSFGELNIWKVICPDPNLILNLKGIEYISNTKKTRRVLDHRNHHLGLNLSLSYDEPLHIVRGFAQYLYDINGRKYLDVVNNVPIVGHSHPAVVKALRQQAAVLNTNTRYLQEITSMYVEALLSHFPKKLEICFFVNSGSEANELALRLAKTYTNRENFIVLDHAYHGNTNSTIKISPYKFKGKGGAGKPDNVHIAPLPYHYRGKYRGDDTAKEYANEVKQLIDSLNQNNTPIAAFIAESFAGVGGQIEFPAGYLSLVYDEVRQNGGVCIADEVQVGFARIGSHFWGFETQEVVPDIVTLGKPIGNGHPLGAVITTLAIAKAFDNGMEFFSTTGGNTVSMAVGKSVLEVIETKNLQKNAKIVGEYFIKRLIELSARTPYIGDIRGRGLFIGIEIVKSKETKEPNPKLCNYIIEEMKKRSILLSVDGPDFNVIKIKPPLIFNQINVDHMISQLEIIFSYTCLK